MQPFFSRSRTYLYDISMESPWQADHNDMSHETLGRAVYEKSAREVSAKIDSDLRNLLLILVILDQTALSPRLGRRLRTVVKRWHGDLPMINIENEYSNYGKAIDTLIWRYKEQQGWIFESKSNGTFAGITWNSSLCWYPNLDSFFYRTSQPKSGGRWI